EIGGTKLQLGLGRGDGRIEHLIRLTVDPAAGASRIRDQIKDAFHPQVHDQGPVVSGGIRFGGPVDAERGVVLRSFQLRGWEDFDRGNWVRRTLGVHHGSLHNDADTAALGEARFGAGVGLSPILYVNSGSGIGGGLILDGRIYRGSSRGAMEIGHLWISTNAY